MAADKALALLGLARRAGKLAPGFEAAKEAARSGQAALLLAAADLSEKTASSLRQEGDRAGVPLRRFPAGMDQIGQACGLRGVGALAVTDRGFAGALARELDYKEETSV